MTEHVDDAMKQAAEAIRAMRHVPPNETAAQARVRACAAIAAQKELEATARRAMTDAIAAKRTKSNGAKPVAGEATSLSEDVIKALAEGLVPFLRETIAEAVTPLRERLDAIEQRKGLAPLAARLAHLEHRALSDGGTWKKETHYEPNELVTSDGTLWIALRPNVASKPPGDDWRQLHRTIGRR